MFEKKQKKSGKNLVWPFWTVRNANRKMVSLFFTPWEPKKRLMPASISDKVVPLCWGVQNAWCNLDKFRQVWISLDWFKYLLTETIELVKTLTNLLRCTKCLDMSVARTKSMIPWRMSLKESRSRFWKMFTRSSDIVNLKPKAAWWFSKTLMSL